MKKGRFTALFLTTALIMAPLAALPAFAADAPAPAPHEHPMHPQLTEAQMKFVHDAMHSLHEKDKAASKDMQKLHKQMHDILEARTFDQKAFLDVTQKHEDLHAQMQRARVEAFASIAGQFTPEQRRHLVMMFAHHHDMHDHPGMGHHPMMQNHEEWEHEGEWHHAPVAESPSGSGGLAAQVAPLPDPDRHGEYPPYSH